MNISLRKTAGIDIGSEKIFISIDGLKEVKSFETYTGTIRQAVDYLKKNGVTTVAMESTGVYWVVLYEMIEAAGIEGYLVNASHIKHVPGRKSDVQDCQWICQLHKNGLLRASHVPESDIKKLRSYVRQREEIIGMGAQHINHMQKALDLMNIKVHNVISEVTGVSGLAMIRAIIAGERNPETLVEMCNIQIKKHKREEVIKSLEGTYSEENIFLLKQSIECWEFYNKKISDCDKQIEALLTKMSNDKGTDIKADTIKPIRHHKPEIEGLHEMLMKITGGKNPTSIIGVTDMTILRVIAEIGLDLSKWENSKHFTAWLGLAPKKNQSGKFDKRSHFKIHTRAGQYFRTIAMSVAKSKKSALSAFYRKIKSRSGPKTAMKALARKIAEMFYYVMTKGIEYVEKGIKTYEENYKNAMIKRLQKQANLLGFVVTPR
jgi:transposase